MIAFGIIELLQQIAGFKAWWDKLPSQFKRYASFALAGAVGLLFFGAQVWLGYKVAPDTLQAWAEALFAIVAGQVVHAIVRLR